MITNLIKKWSLPYPVYAIILGTLLSRFGTAMVTPYVAILLVNNKHLAYAWVGVVLAGSYIAQALGASVANRFTSKMESFFLIQLATYFYTAIFFCLGLISTYVTNAFFVGFGFILCFIFAGACRSIIETTGQTLMSATTPIQQKNLAFSLRYTCINIGASLGPLVAVILGVLNSNDVFFISALFVLIYAIILRLTVRTKYTVSTTQNTGNLTKQFHLLLTHNKLFYFVIASGLSYTGFTALETLFAYTVYQYIADPTVFATMMMINGITVVSTQMALVSYTSRFDIHYVYMAGIGLLSLGLLGVAFATTHPLIYFISMFVFTLGEILTISLIGLYIDGIATKEERHLFFSISNFAMLGRVLGPPLAAILCGLYGVKITLLCIATLCLLGIPLIVKAKNAKNSPAV